MDTVLTYSLSGLLPQGTVLVFYPALFTLSCLTVDHGTPCMLASLQLTPQEWSVVKPLLDASPGYCPLEALHASFYGMDLAASAARLEETKGIPQEQECPFPLA